MAALSDDTARHAQWNASPLEMANVSPSDQDHPSYSEKALGDRLERDLGVQRNGLDLERLVAELPLEGDGSGAPSLVAALAARSALLRTESRGAHYRLDFPEMSVRWQGRILWQRDRGASFEEVKG